MTAPTLHDDRIDQMRLTVMHSVDTDIKRRGRRARNVIGLIAASVLVVGLGGYAIESLDSTHDTSSSVAADEGAGRSERNGAAAEDSGSAGADQKSVAPEDDRQVITTGEVNVTVEDPRGAAQRLSTWVESIGGRIDNRSESGSGDQASAFVTVRVPSTKVTATIERLKTYGTVEDVSLHNEDVTARTRDLDARIDALQLSIGRLGKILAAAGSSAEVVKAEDALTQRQEQLESLQAQRKAVTDQMALSTLSINLSQRPAVDSVEPGGFTGGLRDGWNALVSTVNRTVEIVGVLLPWALIAAVLVGIGRLVLRRRA
ncbi:MAG: hypothetical protein JWR27_2119 [Aeromicrobium sp.]|nr:hypothetical protein [Aeromicrobium sp.]